MQQLPRFYKRSQAPVKMKTPDTGQNPKTSRVIVRNLPKHCTEVRLRDWISQYVKGCITDVRIPTNSKGESRRIGFIGFRTDEDAAVAIRNLDRVFLDTSRISASPAFPPGSKDLPRPWSRHAQGSSAYERFQQRKQAQKEEKRERKAALAKDVQKDIAPSKRTEDSEDDFLKQQFFLVEAKRKGQSTWCDTGTVHPSAKPAKRARHQVSVETVKPTKAGVAATRQHVEFDDADGNDAGGVNADIGATEDFAGLLSHKHSEVDTGKKDDGRHKEDEEEDDPLEWLRHRAAQESEHQSTPKDVISDISCTSASVAPVSQDTSGCPFLNSNTNDSIKASAGTPAPKGSSVTLTDNTASQPDKEEDTLIGDTGRLLVLNLPYTVEEAELKEHFSVYGEISSVHICRDENRLTSRGRAFVQFAFPEHAVQAASEVHMSLFQGRIIRVKGALPLPVKEQAYEKVVGRGKQATSSYKRQLEEKLKKNAENPRIWNLLYVSANAAMNTAAGDLGMDKRDLLGLDTAADDSIAARVALGETHVIHQTKQWLRDEGIDASAFDRQGASLLNSRISDDPKHQVRSDDAIIVKHLPPQITQDDLFYLFSKSGPLVRCCLSPSKTVAVVQFMESAHAKKAFTRLAFSRMKNVPLLLEWAPVSVFCSPKRGVPLVDPSSPTPAAAGSAAAPCSQTTVDVPDASNDTQQIKELLEREAEAQTNLHVSVFIKNLNFKTSDATLAELFSSAPGFIQATIMKKRQAVSETQATDTPLDPNEPAPVLSMGYGFAEFDSLASATEVIKRFQGKMVDGHVLQLKLSERSSAPSQPSKSKEALASEAPNIDLSKVTQKLTVRNLAFQATKKDLRRLFQAFGNVVAVRIPKKPDGTSRGYGFVEFLSRAEAITALEALQHTHLYGRKMVLEPADTLSTSVESVRAKQAAQILAKSTVSESRSRKRAALMDSTDSHKFESLLN